MAGGGKETPRQAMINMMYLVLTALLALQVSNAVLDKFILLDKTLKHSVQVIRAENDDRIHAIEKQVEERGGKERDKAIEEKVHQVHDKTNDLITYLQSMRDSVEQSAGGRDPETKKLKKPADYTDQMAYTLGSPIRPKGAGYDLENRLNQYAKDMNQVLSTLETSGDSSQTPPVIPSIPEEIVKDMGSSVDDHSGKHVNKDFAHLFFENTPVVAVLTLITQFQSEVARIESEVLVELGKQVGAEELRFDKIEAVVSPEASVVAAGTKYKAKMFLVASSSTAKPRMTLNGSPIKVVDGKGEVEIMAKGGGYNKEGIATRSWNGSITIKGPFGDTTFVIKEEYSVAKPVIQVQSASVSALYLNCGNELNIQVPALGSAYDPSFRAAGGEVIKGTKKGFITVVPNKAKVTISVSNAGSKLGEEVFRVKPVPKPDIKLVSRGKPIDLKNGAKASSLRSLEIRAVADSDFKQFLPKDARYRVTQVEVTLARGKRALKVIKSRKAKVSLSGAISQAKPGDRIIVDVKKVQRRNFKNKSENVRMGLQIFTVPLS